MFIDGDIPNVLTCGGEFPDHIKEKGIFKPAYYIIMSHEDNNHFNLIKVKDRRIFKYNEIPYDIKELIKTRCMETSDNSEWNFIGKFKNNLSVDSKKENTDHEPETESDEKKDDQDAEDEDDKEEDGSKSVTSDVENKKIYNSLYDDSVVFQFH